MKFKNYLKRINACPDAVEWVGEKDLQTAWNTCERGDWMLWLMRRANLCNIKTLTLAKARCASLVKHLMKDQRSLDALQAAFDFAEGKITKDQLASAADAAADAADAAASYAAAAYAAASASADTDADAAYASASAAAAASAADTDADAAYASASAAEIATLRECANICREALPNPEIKVQC